MEQLFSKWLHVSGGLLAFIGIGGAVLLATSQNDLSAELRKRVAKIHGIGMLLLLLGGLGAWRALGSPVTGWILAKFVIWLALGVAPLLARKLATVRPLLLWGFWGLASLAVWLGLSKPF